MNENSLVFPELPQKKYVLGLDMATHASGISIVDQDGYLIDHKCIYADGEEFDRIKYIYFELDNYIKSNKLITNAVLEDILLNKWMPNLNACRSLIRLQGAIVSCLWNNNIKFDIYSANHWKSVVGVLNGPNGRSRDAQKQYSIDLIKNKYNIDVDDNQADSICLALSYLINNNYITHN